MARSAAQRAALRKAQLASAKKRKGRARVRNVGRGLRAGATGNKKHFNKGSRKRVYRGLRVAGAVGGAVAVATARHYGKKELRKHTVGVKIHKNPTGKRGRVRKNTFGDGSGLYSASTKKHDIYVTHRRKK